MSKLGKNEITDYINQLKQFEKSLSGEESVDMSFMTDLNELLGKLNTEFKEQVNNVSYDLKVNVKRLHPNAVIPTYSKDGDAGMDLTIVDIKESTERSISFGFGIAMEIPRGYVGLIFPRSSIRNYDLILSNCVGVIDSGYRGEIMCTFKYSSDDSYIREYKIGDRGAQIIILPYPKTQFVEVPELTKTERNDGGFGSSGK